MRTTSHAADREIEFLTKSNSKPYGCATTMPPAWELKLMRAEKQMQIRVSFDAF